MEITARRLGPALEGLSVESALAPGINALKTFDPPLQALEGRAFTGVRRRGKLLFLELGDIVLLLHLMSAGRLQLQPKRASLKDKTGPALYQELVWGDFPKEIHLRLVRDVSASQMQEAIRDALEKADKARTDQFVAYFGDIKTGEEYVLRWAAGGTLETFAKGTPKPPIADKNFAAAVFGIWLGDEPVQDDIKRDLVARVPPMVK